MRLGSGAILWAVRKRWTEMKLDTVLTGGLHLGTAPRGTAMPYCVLNVVSEVADIRTSSGNSLKHEYSRIMLDFTVWSTGGLLSTEDHADAIRLKFDNVPLMLQTGKDGQVLRFRWVNSMPLQSPDNTSVWSYTVTYDVLRHRAEVLN